MNLNEFLNKLDENTSILTRKRGESGKKWETRIKFGIPDNEQKGPDYWDALSDSRALRKAEFDEGRDFSEEERQAFDAKRDKTAPPWKAAPAKQKATPSKSTGIPQG